MAVKIVTTDDYNKNADRCKGDECPCIICGKPVRTQKYAVHVHMGGGWVVTESEAAQLDNASDLGFYPLGSECYRKHPELREYVSK